MKFGNFSRTYKGNNPPKSTTAIYCGSSIFRDACYQLVSAFLIIYITFAGVLDVTDQTMYIAQIGVINLIIMICRVWDGINDPIMGWLIEKVKFKSGKYKPWILIGGILNSIVVLVLFLARPTGWGFVALFGVFYFLWDIVYTINDIAYWSMLPSLTSDEKKRNKITTIMQICISVGVFGVYGVGNLLTGAVDALLLYTIMPIIIVVLFMLSQLALVFVAKERDRKDLQNQNEEPVKFKDMLRLFKRNDQFRINIIAILLNYLGAGVLTGFAVYWFNLVYGYGPGGTIAFIFTIMYAVGTLLSQCFYPLLSKFLVRKKLLILSGILITIGYAWLFLLGTPLFGVNPVAFNDLTFLVYPAAVLIFFGQGILAIVIIMQMQSVIEYNDYKFHKREEALVSSMRALTAKISSSIQQGLIWATLSLSGLYAATQFISSCEQESNLGILTREEITIKIDEYLATNVEQWQLIVTACGMLIIPWLLLMASIALCAFAFKIDEKRYAEIVKELEERKEAIVEVKE